MGEEWGLAALSSGHSTSSSSHGDGTGTGSFSIPTPLQCHWMVFWERLAPASLMRQAALLHAVPQKFARYLSGRNKYVG